MIENLNETVEMMNSSDYKERFKAEYYQLVYRTKKLEKMLNDLYEGKLTFEPDCPNSVLENQFDVMNKYIRILKERANYEKIDL